MAAPTGGEHLGIQAALDRHEQRREAGLPTISLLIGPIGLAVQAGRQWAAARGRSVVALEEPSFEPAVAAWVARLASARDLVQDAVAWLARRRDCPVGPLGDLIRRKTAYELAEFLEFRLPAPSRTGVESVCRWLLHGAVTGERLEPSRLAVRLAALLADHDPGWPRVVPALCDLIPPGQTPVLLWTLQRGSESSWEDIELMARVGAELTSVEPRLALLLALPPDGLDAFGRLAPETRAKALLREAVVPIPSLGDEVIRRRLEESVPSLTPALSGSIRRLAVEGASEALVGRFHEAARAALDLDPAAPDQVERVRSAAERFLFERLESLPETSGLFQLNARVELPFGSSREWEVDLLAESLRLALEVDGYYHFRDADAYRRDRRKDLELQQHGYLIVRVLADDVVRRLETILDLILAAVASQRDHLKGK